MSALRVFGGGPHGDAGAGTGGSGRRWTNYCWSREEILRCHLLELEQHRTSCSLPLSLEVQQNIHLPRRRQMNEGIQLRLRETRPNWG